MADESLETSQDSVAPAEPEQLELETHTESNEEHEASDAVESQSVSSEKPADGVEDEHVVGNMANGSETSSVPAEAPAAPAEDMPAPTEAVKEETKEEAPAPTAPKAKPTAKPSIAVKPAKAAGAPPTPLVKKVSVHAHTVPSCARVASWTTC